jgi:predicted transcriptional regulator
LTPTHAKILQAIKDHPGSSSSEIARLMGKQGDRYIKNCLLDLMDVGHVTRKPTKGEHYGLVYYVKEASTCTK